MAKQRFELRDGAQQKFWQVQRTTSTLTTEWGRIGAKAQSTKKTFPTPAAATKAEQAQIAEKVGKGYVQIESGYDSKAWNDLVDGFRALAKSLEKAGFEPKASFGKPASRAQIDKAQKARGVGFPASLVSLLETIDGFSLHCQLPHETIQHRICSTAEHIRLGDAKGEVWFEEFDDAKSPRRRYVIADWPQEEFSYGFVVESDANANPEIQFYMHGEDLSPAAANLRTYLRSALDKHRDALAQLTAPTSEKPAPEAKRADAKAPTAALALDRVTFVRNQFAGRGTRIGSFRINRTRKGPGKVRVDIQPAATAKLGDPYELVRFDDGYLAWLASTRVKSHKRSDAFERIRATGIPAGRDLDCISDLVRAVGPTVGYSSPYKIATELLFPHPIEQTLTALIELEREGRRKLFGPPDAPKTCTLKKTGDERAEDLKSWAKVKWKFEPSDTIRVLFKSLAMAIGLQSRATNTPPFKLVPKALLDELKRLDDDSAYHIKEVLTAAAPRKPLEYAGEWVQALPSLDPALKVPHAEPGILYEDADGDEWVR